MIFYIALLAYYCKVRLATSECALLLEVDRAKVAKDADAQCRPVQTFDGKDGREKYPKRWIMLPPFF